MIKNQVMLSPVSVALAAMSMANANFLHARQQAISLMPIKPAENAGYIWRRIFLKKSWSMRSGRRER